MTRNRVITLLAVLLVAFVTADINARPEPDHYALEQWRNNADSAGCAPCGAVCAPAK